MTRIAIVVSMFDREIAIGLLEGGFAAFDKAHIPREQVTMIEVPGSFEIPLTAQKLAETGKYDGILCLGCVIKGETYHFEVISNEVAAGIREAMQRTGVPMGFGVLTTYTREQALARISSEENKGFEAASALVQMTHLLKGNW